MVNVWVVNVLQSSKYTTATASVYLNMDSGYLSRVGQVNILSTFKKSYLKLFFLGHPVVETPLLFAAKWISCEEKDFFSKPAVQIVLKLKGVDLSMILGHLAIIER